MNYNEMVQALVYLGRVPSGRAFATLPLNSGIKQWLNPSRVAALGIEAESPQRGRQSA